VVVRPRSFGYIEKLSQTPRRALAPLDSQKYPRSRLSFGRPAVVKVLTPAHSRKQNMAGRAHRLIQQLYEARGSGPSTLHFLRAHLALSGIDPDDHTETSRDDERTVALLEQMLASIQKAPATKAAERRDSDVP